MSKQKFNIGDKVVLSKTFLDNHKSDYIKYGTGTVTGFEYDRDRQRTTYKVNFKNTVLYLVSTDLDAYNEQVCQTKFKIGDKVHLTNTAKQWFIEHDIHNVDLNKEYTVVKVNSFKQPSSCDYFVSGVMGYSFSDNDLVLSTGEPKVEIKEVITNVPKVFEALIPGLKTKCIESDPRLINRWKEICNYYLKLFCDKHEFSYEPDCWVGSDPGTIANISDMFVSMDNIRYDIDNDIPEEKFEKWYWKNLDVYELTGENYMNFESYCKGAPDHWTDERMQKIREGKARINQLKKELQEEINNIKNGNRKSLF